MEKSAVISACGKYRYELSRTWDASKGNVLFIMLNPSTADGDIDDPTIRRCTNFVKSWGYGGFYVGNLFAYRSTEPKGLIGQSDPIGKDNAFHLRDMSDLCTIAVCAWGNSPILKKLKADHNPLSNIGLPLHYISLSNDGTPKHPLYLKGDLKPIEYELNRINNY